MLRPLLLLLPLLAAALPAALGTPAGAQSRAPEQEALLSPAEKRAIQEALVWTGDYEAAIDGVIGPATRSAIRQFQSEQGFRPTGYLRQRHLDRLLEARRDWTERFGWEIRRFPDLGMEIGIPSALFREPEARENGLRFRSKEDQPRSELRLYSAPPMSDARFDELREELIDREHFGREVYDAGDEDWFVFSGTSEAGVEQYTYAVNREAGARGFSFRYLDRHEDELSRLNVAMYNSLETFPAEGQRPAPDTAGGDDDAGAGDGRLLFTDRQLSLLDGERSDGRELPSELGRQSVGFLVNPDGAVLTTASAIEGCEHLRVNRRIGAEVTAIDRRHDLALLSVPTGGRDFPHLSFRGAPLDRGERLRALDYRRSRTGLTVAPGTVEALSGRGGDIRHFRVSSELGPNSRGAPLIDAAGRVAGLALGRPDGSGDDGVLDPEDRLATRAGILEAFLGAHGIDYEIGPERAAPEGELPPATRLATLRIECAR